MALFDSINSILLFVHNLGSSLFHSGIFAFSILIPLICQNVTKFFECANDNTNEKSTCENHYWKYELRISQRILKMEISWNQFAVWFISGKLNIRLIVCAKFRKKIREIDVWKNWILISRNFSKTYHSVEIAEVLSLTQKKSSN